MTPLELINSVELLIKSQDPLLATAWTLYAFKGVLSLSPAGTVPAGAFPLATFHRADIERGPDDALWHKVTLAIHHATAKGLLA